MHLYVSFQVMQSYMQPAANLPNHAAYAWPVQLYMYMYMYVQATQGAAVTMQQLQPDQFK